MSAPVSWSLPAAVDLGRLGPLHGSISLGAGQSTGIHPLPSHDGWLVKLYLKPATPADALRLTWMVGLPESMQPADRALVEAATSWPVAGVLDDQGRTIGCVLPHAPDRFRNPADPERFLEVDWLARSDAAFARRGTAPPTYAERLSVCRSVVSVAALLGRYGLVYSDWSYSNAFYSPTDFTAYVIDVDGVGRYRMPNIFQPNWDDPHTPRSVPADAHTDRYRVALLAARLLTGERSIAHVLHALDDLPDPATGGILRDCLLAADRMHRPAPATLLAVLDGRPYLRLPIDLMPLPPRPAAIPAAARVHPVPVARGVVTLVSPASAPAEPVRSRAGRWVTVLFIVFLALLAVIIAAAQ
jgi:hypothetical protein